MATTAEHAQYALRYGETADRLRNTDPAASGEVNWGAVIQAAHAVAHEQDNPRHPQSRNGVRDIIDKTSPRSHVQPANESTSAVCMAQGQTRSALARKARRR